MKRSILTAGFLLFAIITSTGQEMRLNVYASYVFDDSFDSYYSDDNYYDAKIKGGLQWGGGFEYKPMPEVGVELLYLRQDTKAPTTYIYNTALPQESEFDVGINYIMLAGNKYMQTASGKVEGFGGLMLGMVIASAENPDTGRSDSATKFAWGARLGGIVWASEKVGVRLQAQILSAVQSMGGGLYFGTGGSGAGVSTYSTIYQFSLGGGLVFRFEKGG